MPEQVTSRLPASTIERATRALSAHFAGVAVELKGPISVRNNSEIFQALIAAPVRLDAALKICLVPRTLDADGPVARDQFDALDRVNTALSKLGTRFCVPRPLCLFAELGAFAMAWAQGESLTKKLSHSPVFVQGPAWFEEAGVWLGNFHQAGPIRRQRVDLSDRLSALKEVAESPLPSPSFANAVLKLHRCESGLNGVEVDASWLHGDCKPDNFILGDKNTFGIDIALAHENPVEYDIAQFLNNLGLLLSSPRYLYLWGMQSQFEAAFLRGYLRAGPGVSVPYLNWLRLNFLLCFWHSESRGRKASVRTWVLSRMFAKTVRNLTGRINLDQTG